MPVALGRIPDATPYGRTHSQPAERVAWPAFRPSRSATS